MRKVLKSRLTAGILVLVVVCLGIVLAGDVEVKEGTIEAENIDATGDVSGATITRNGTEINAGYLAIDGSNAADDIDIGGWGFTANYIQAVGGFISNGFITTAGTVTWSGGGSVNANTAYTHSQDNSQAHSDYLINNGDDYTTGSIVAAGNIVGLTSLGSAGNLEISGKGTFGSLKLPVKSTTGDPASPFEGQIYVNTQDNKVRVYADGAWRDLATW